MREHRYGTQILGQYTNPEQQRLSAIADAYDPATQEYLIEAGASAG